VYCEAQRHGDHVELTLRGDWRLAAVRDIQAELAAVPMQGTARLRIAAAAARLDLSGAWVLQDFIAAAAAAGVSSEFDGAVPAALALIGRTRDGGAASSAVPGNLQLPWLDPALAVEGLGRRAVRSWRLVESLLGFIGRVAVAFMHDFGSLKRWRPASIARHVYDTGITAIPIVALIAFLIAVILAYMGAQQLRKFGADIFVVDLVTVGVLRELGVLLTAIIVAGRSGSAFAAELGSMRLNEEVDALHAIGIDPVE